MTLFWRKRPQQPCHPDFDQLLQEAQAHFMATLADVQNSLVTLKSDFDTLVVAAKAAYDAKTGAATAADLDGLKATVDGFDTAVKGTLATITGATS